MKIFKLRYRIHKVKPEWQIMSIQATNLEKAVNQLFNYLDVAFILHKSEKELVEIEYCLELERELN